MSSLSHRERVLRCVDHLSIDRPPMLFRADPEPLKCFCNHFGVPDELGLLRRLDVDLYHRLPTFHINEYKAAPDVAKMKTPADVLAAPWPGPEILDLDACERDLRVARDTGLAVSGGIWATVFTLPRLVAGEEYFLTTMAMEPELTQAIFDRVTDMFLELNRALLDRCASCIDIYFFGTDLGTQRGLFISPAMIRQFIIPNFRRIAQQAHSYGLKVMFHSCGAVSEIIPFFIEAGIDILDPIQVSAAGMDPDSLARFKGQIAFHGGISTQTTLPFGTPEQVRRETLHAIEVLGPTGYIAGPDQDLIGEIPIENFLAMYDTIRSGPPKA